MRGTPTGPWTSRHHRWEHVGQWWPAGLPILDVADAQRELARRWLARFGPATVDDLQWWTGWGKATTARAIAGLPIEHVDLHGRPGIGLDLDEVAAGTELQGPPIANLLPALDPTAMGWKHRDWYLGIDPAAIFDRAGNIGPTVWWNGEIVGAWAVNSSREIRTACPADRGGEASAAIATAAAHLQTRLNGAVPKSAIRTPLEQSLTA